MVSKEAYITAVLNRKVSPEWFETCQVNRGYEIIYQGDKTDYLYIVREGRVHQLCNRLLLRTIKDGKIFGLGALVEASDCQFEAANDCMLYRIKKKTFFIHLDTMEMRASGLMQRRWVCEQLRLVKFMDDTTGLKFKRESKIKKQPYNVCHVNSKPPPRKLSITSENIKGVDYL